MLFTNIWFDVVYIELKVSGIKCCCNITPNSTYLFLNREFILIIYIDINFELSWLNFHPHHHNDNSLWMHSILACYCVYPQMTFTGILKFILFTILRLTYAYLKGWYTKYKVNGVFILNAEHEASNYCNQLIPMMFILRISIIKLTFPL